MVSKKVKIRKSQLKWAIERNNELIKNQKERLKHVRKDVNEEIAKLRKQQQRARQKLRRL